LINKLPYGHLAGQSDFPNLSGCLSDRCRRREPQQDTHEAGYYGTPNQFPSFFHFAPPGFNYVHFTFNAGNELFNSSDLQEFDLPLCLHPKRKNLWNFHLFLGRIEPLWVSPSLSINYLADIITLGSQVLKEGKSATINIATIITKKKGVTPLTILEIGDFVIPMTTYKFIPTGGVIIAISMFKVTITANQIPSKPREIIRG
jgi:hypothetical protein